MFDRIFIDMDGVLVDFVSHMFCMRNIDERDIEWPVGVYDLEEALGLDEDALWEEIAGLGSKFWATLRPYPWKDELLDLAHSYLKQPGGELCIVSQPRPEAECAAGKLEWLRIHVPWAYENQSYMLGPQKWLLAKKGRLLIDDSDKNECEFRANDAAALLFPQPWNQNWQYVGSRMTYVREMFAQKTREYLEALGSGL